MGEVPISQGGRERQPQGIGVGEKKWRKEEGEEEQRWRRGERVAEGDTSR